MMIQNFMFQGMNNIGNKASKSVRTESKGSSNDFNKVLDMKNKEAYMQSKNNAENKIQKDSNHVTRNYEVQSNTRKINVKEDGKNTKESLKESDDAKSKKEQVIDELVQSISNILAIFQDISDLNLENMENLNLEMSVEDLEKLKIALESIINSLELKENNVPMQEIAKDINNMIISAQEKGNIEIDAEKFLLDLKKIIGLVETEGSGGQYSLKSEEMLENLKKLINIDEESKPIDQTKDNTIVQKDDSSAESRKTDVKITVSNDKGNELENDFRVGSENIVLEDSLDISINQDKVNIEKVVSNELTNMQNNLQLNNQQDVSIDKNTLNLQQYLDIDKADLIKQVTSKVKADYDNEINEIKIKLSPEHLGNLTIKVTLERGIVTARALVENLNVKQMLESNVSELKDSLKEQGINFESIDVSVGQDSEYDQGNSQAFAESKKIKVPKINIDNSNSMNLYEDIEENLQNQNASVGEGSVDITI
ncbi:flagellar hook-length control protein FliK [Gottschalkia acidurici 9a]|uniref:Flagellar hook-length control protein FliK n=1 Tax=Gottschalkia acidurici (strain ATCC 7906 / DSM 604 / BCRC 14475 / CIP 104303 / KCTC 5404 / NCIMB 10678 / 9a) TaxID=1128398 RepID=K0B1N1_GOTA9|nr:flagellar hook-length control protein FliK [Gottschalkia acidurici]AFS78606.1 flagellar hook-length control protein FliK [Gottschalkia acidurici 9a]